MFEVIGGFIIGYLVRLLIAIAFDEFQTDKEFRKKQDRSTAE